VALGDDFMGFNKVWPKMKDIPGWMSEPDMRFLYNTAKTIPSLGVIVEIGSFKGRSTVALAFGSKEENKNTVYAIDKFEEFTTKQHKTLYPHFFDDFMRNVTDAGVKDIIIPIKMKSEEAVKGWDKAISFLFIDGDHAYESVKQDFELWKTHVRDGGVVAFHDTRSWPGPIQLVKEIDEADNAFKKTVMVDEITAFVRVR